MPDYIKPLLNRPVAIVALVFLWIAFAIVAVYFFTNTGGGAIDFEAYYYASREVAVHDNPYTLGEQGITNRPYLYPPLLAILLLPLASLSLMEAAFVWSALNFMLLLFTLWLLSHSLEDSRLRLLWFAAPVFFTPTLMALVHGQVTVVLFALVAGTWVAMRRENRVLAGILLALAVWIKIYPAVFLAYFLWKREWRVVTSAMIAGALLGLFQIIWVGEGIVSAFFTDVLFGLGVEGQPTIANLNSSVVGFTSRLFLSSPRVLPVLHSPTLYAISRVGLSLLIALPTIILASTPVAYHATSSRKRDLEFALVTLGSLLLASTLWESGMVSFLLVYFLLVPDALRTRNWRILWACALSFVLIDSFRLLWPLARNRTLPALLLSAPFFGAMILWSVTALQAWFNSKRKSIVGPAATMPLPNEPI